MSESENKNAFQNLDTEPFTTALTGKISLSPCNAVLLAVFRQNNKFQFDKSVENIFMTI